MSPTGLPRSGRLAAVDYGTVRIGLAVSDPGQSLASPYEIYRRRTREADADHFVKFTREEEIVGLILGLPLHMSGDESQKSFEVRRFGQWLYEITQLPIEYFDERHTSSDAEAILLAANLTSKQRKARLDMLAAQMILSGYLLRRQVELAHFHQEGS